MSIFGPHDESDDVDLFLADPLDDIDDVDVGQTSPSITELDASVDEDEGSSGNLELGQSRDAGERAEWRRLTADDRRIARALDAVEDGDLSIHLYNSHALKVRAQRSQGRIGKIRDWQSKFRWRDPQVWVPNQGWSAWPLNESALLQTDAETACEKLARHHPYAELGEFIMAMMLRFSREQLSRQSDSIQSDDAEQENSLAASGMSSEADSLAGESVSDDHFLALADDEEAEALLQPAIRRIMASLDSSLLSLHRARQNRYGGISESRTSLSRSTSAASSARPSQSARRASRSVSTGHRRSLSIGRRREKASRAAPRDWSELLGFALQSGWSESAISRAAARCSELFGESMDFCNFTAAVTEHSKNSTPGMRSRMQSHNSDQDVKHDVHLHGQNQNISGSNNALVDSRSSAVAPQPGTASRRSARSTLPKPIMLSDSTHQDGFLQPIVASRNW